MIGYNKNEIIGKMRERVTLQNRVITQSDSGFQIEAYNDVSTLWSKVEYKTGFEEEDADKIASQQKINVTLRFNASVNVNSRFVYRNDLFQVEKIEYSDDRRFMTCVCIWRSSYTSIYAGLQLCTAALYAQSSLSASLMRAVNFSSNLSAFGSLSADINFVQKLQSSLTASASVTASPLITKLPTASLTAAGTTSATLTVTASGDADATAFFNRVTEAGGTLSATEQSAINTLVTDLKTYGIWDKMKAIYPMVGASAAACAQNLKSSSFTGTFTSGWTFASTGALPNGTSAYMNTFYIPSIYGLLNSAHLSYYSRTNLSSAYALLGSYENLSGPVNRHYFGQGSSLSSLNSSGEGNYAPASYSGFHIIKRENSTQTKQIYNGINITTSNINSTNRSTVNIYVAAFNLNNTIIVSYNKLECAFATIGDGLTDAEAANFYTAVQAFQTTLNRQV